MADWFENHRRHLTIGAVLAVGAWWALIHGALMPIRDGSYKCGFVDDTSDWHMSLTEPPLSAEVENRTITVTWGGETMPSPEAVMRRMGFLEGGNSQFMAQIDLTSAPFSLDNLTDLDPLGTGTYWVMCAHD